jgi:hypothetical protein
MDRSDPRARQDANNDAEPAFQLAHTTGAGHAVAALLPGEPAYRIAAPGIARSDECPRHSESGNHHHGSYGTGYDLCHQLNQHVCRAGKRRWHLEPPQGDEHGCQQPQ